MKKCPNCSIITEKTAGGNHITCSKGNFQWCWLCNKKYSYAHYQQGKCRGYQFFKPKDEYDIKLAFEGKIKLRASQRQEDLIYIDDNFNNPIRHIFGKFNYTFIQFFIACQFTMRFL